MTTCAAAHQEGQPWHPAGLHHLHLARATCSPVFTRSSVPTWPRPTAATSNRTQPRFSTPLSPSSCTAAVSAHPWMRTRGGPGGSLLALLSALLSALLLALLSAVCRHGARSAARTGRGGWAVTNQTSAVDIYTSNCLTSNLPPAEAGWHATTGSPHFQLSASAAYPLGYCPPVSPSALRPATGRSHARPSTHTLDRPPSAPLHVSGCTSSSWVWQHNRPSRAGAAAAAPPPPALRNPGVRRALGSARLP